MVSITKVTDTRTGWRVRAVLIELLCKDEELLKDIKDFVGVGNIFKGGKDCLSFRVNSAIHLVKIITHFDNYPLITQKLSDYLLFKEVVMMMNKGEHLTREGLDKIVAIRSSLNKGLTPVLKAAFPNILPAARFKLELNPNIPGAEWIAGFVSGEGCFFVQLRKATNGKIGWRVGLSLTIAQHIRDKELMESLVVYLKCGGCYIGRNHVVFSVTKFADILQIIIRSFPRTQDNEVKNGRISKIDVKLLNIWKTRSI